MSHSQKKAIISYDYAEGAGYRFKRRARLNCRDQECIEGIGMHVTIFERVRFSSNHYFILFLFQVDVLGNTDYYTLNRFLKY